MNEATNNRQIGWWLLTVCALVFAMVVLGGVTRLTHSGLSIVEWEPLIGAVPPLSESDWQELFSEYQQTPEYQKVNQGMDLAGFQGIFWLEYLHRLLGRLIGIAFAVPLLWFLLRRQIRRPLAPKLLTMFVLGALQGLLGWLMVASGLVDIPRVSPYRLTAHLGLAVVIYAYMLWVALDLLPSRAPNPATPGGLRRASGWFTGLVFVTILAGGFVAGTRAGFVFNDWPLMHGQWIPDGLYATHPWWADWFENLATVQFHHRLLAYTVALAAFLLWYSGRRKLAAGRPRSLLDLLLAVTAAQLMLGILTLLHVVPVPLAAAHQAGALVVLTVAIVLRHVLRRG
ncbi:MAG: COX15/CtaA family protein [Gammaproteobacteria bacterium]|jgi:cytochrome c oxidase assembly protein subunit 15|nr:COX15/CtaA family protein [Gammaproteobacteria bacterium]